MPARLRVSQNRASGDVYAGCAAMPYVPHAAEIAGVPSEGGRQVDTQRGTHRNGAGNT